VGKDNTETMRLKLAGGRAWGRPNLLEKTAAAQVPVDCCERLFDELLEGVYDAVLITTITGKIIRQNSRARSSLGLSDSDAANRSIFDLIPGMTDAHLEAMRQQLNKHGRVFIEAPAVRDCQGSFPADITASLIHLTGSADGELCFFIRDISSRLQTEGELATERHLMQQLMENSQDTIYFKDADGRFMRVNRKHAEYMGLTHPDEAIGKTDHDIHLPQLADETKVDEQQIMHSRQPMLNKEENVCWKDGREMWVSTSKQPLIDADGNLVGIFGISRDITAQKIVEADLARKKDQLEADLRIAREIQCAFIDHDVPQLPRHATPETTMVEFFRHYQPSGAIGGDFFDIHSLSDTTAAVLICDVMGHDVRAALVMASLHGLSERLEAVAHDPGKFLTELNHSLRTILDRAETLVFASAFYLVLDIGNGLLHYANAGHPSPYYRSGGDCREIVALAADSHEIGPALGLFHDAAYTTTTMRLRPDSWITLFTDGIYEIADHQGESFGRERLQALLVQTPATSPQQYYPSVLDAVKQFANGNNFDDDVCMVGIWIRELLNN